MRTIRKREIIKIIVEIKKLENFISREMTV